MSDDKPADIGLWATFLIIVGLWATVLVIVGAIVLLFVVIINTAKSEELSEISVANASYCALYSRSEVLHDALHGRAPTADTDYILEAAKKHYAACLSALPTLLPVSDSLRDWLADMRDLLVRAGSERVAEAGTKPATEAPSDEEWRRQCRAEYLSWEEETGTVIRTGNPARQRCPCGQEVNCQ